MKPYLKRFENNKIILTNSFDQTEINFTHDDNQILIYYI